MLGEVVDIKLPKTDLKTVDGNFVSIPNKHIVGEIIHNYSSNKKIDITVGVSYGADMDKAVQVVTDVVKNEGTGNFTMERVFSVTGSETVTRVCLGNTSATANTDVMAIANLTAGIALENGDTLNITYSVAAEAS